MSGPSTQPNPGRAALAPEPHDPDAALATARPISIDRLVQELAQQLRNPLFSISSAAQLLRFRVRDDPVIERNVGRILRDVERLNAVVSSLTDYARPAPLQLAPVDPDHLWHSVLAAKRGLLESKALVIRHEAASPRATCDIDAEQMSHVLVNVLTNAADAAPEGTDLALSSSSAAVRGAWRCRLHNDGPPISPEVLPRVFDLFFSTKPGGAGVGLALCRRIVEEHGGTITLESTADAGTTLTITVPAHQTAFESRDTIHG